MNNEIIKPKILNTKDFKFNGPDDLTPNCRYTEITDEEGFGGFGLYFMEPGAQTNTFSLESEDDKTADEWYGPCFEFYYLLAGEVTMYWGKDDSKLKEGNASALLLKAGDFGCWEKEWKYSAKNTGDIPAMFFWGLAEAPKGIVSR